jgi:hypothetical protein
LTPKTNAAYTNAGRSSLVISTAASRSPVTMTDRTEQLEAAVRAQDALIAEAQRLLTLYLAKQTESTDLINNLLWLFDGRQRREAQRLAHEALGEDFGNNA